MPYNIFHEAKNLGTQRYAAERKTYWKGDWNKEKLVQMKERSKNWENLETKYWVKLKDEMQSRFNNTIVKHVILWQEI